MKNVMKGSSRCVGFRVRVVGPGLGRPRLRQQRLG